MIRVWNQIICEDIGLRILGNISAPYVPYSLPDAKAGMIFRVVKEQSCLQLSDLLLGPSVCSFLDLVMYVFVVIL